MAFNELQTALWKHMSEFISDYRQGKLSFKALVADLEGALQAGDFPEEGDLLRQWYDHWTPLEILHATKGDSVTFRDAENFVAAMEKFLESSRK